MADQSGLRLPPTTNSHLRPWWTVTTPQANNNSDDDGESLDELIELLRESSEIDGEDDAWENFRKEISLRRQDYLAEVDLRKVRPRAVWIMLYCCFASYFNIRSWLVSVFA